MVKIVQRLQPQWCTCPTAQGFVYSEAWATYVHSACGKPTKPVFDRITP